MAIFPNIAVETTVQVGDQTRLDVSRSFVTQDEADISLVEIQPETGGDWINVTDNLYLDWAYSTAGTKTVSVRITTDGSPTSETAEVVVVSAATDNLFASDVDLIAWEPDVMKFLRPGRNTFKDVHREAQKQILDWLDQQGIRDSDEERLTSAAVVDVQEVKEWSKFLALQIIMESASNAVDDVFSQKARKYESLAVKARNRTEVKLDLDGDGTAENSERSWVASVKVVRR